MKFEIQAACPYCGQMMFVDSPEPEPAQEIISEPAADKCDCDEALAARGMKATEVAIEGVLGAGGGGAIRKGDRTDCDKGCAGYVHDDPAPADQHGNALCAGRRYA